MRVGGPPTQRDQVRAGPSIAPRWRTQVRPCDGAGSPAATAPCAREPRGSQRCQGRCLKPRRAQQRGQLLLLTPWMVTGQEEEATWEPQAEQMGAESSADSAQGHVACTHMQLSTREPAFPRLGGKKAHGSLDPKLLKTGMQINTCICRFTAAERGNRPESIKG